MGPAHSTLRARVSRYAVLTMTVPGWYQAQHALYPARQSIPEETDWIEPVLLWIAVHMPTGSGNSSLCKYLKKLVDDACANTELDSPNRYSHDQSFEKVGALMQKTIRSC